MIVGQTYLERGRPVRVLIAWQGPKKNDALAARIERFKRKGKHVEIVLLDGLKKGSGPRNVLIEREDGSLVVRPFRGLRRLPEVRA